MAHNSGLHARWRDRFTGSELRARAARFPRFRGPIVGTKAVIQNSRTVGGKQQATFAGYFDRLDSFIEAIRHSRTPISSLYIPATFHSIEEDGAALPG